MYARRNEHLAKSRLFEIINFGGGGEPQIHQIICKTKQHKNNLKPGVIAGAPEGISISCSAYLSYRVAHGTTNIMISLIR